MRNKGRSRFIALCVAPAVILFFIFMVMRTINAFRISLFERGAYSPNETFVGLNNFQVLFKDTKFITSMQNTIQLIVTVTIITFFFAIIFSAIYKPDTTGMLNNIFTFFARRDIAILWKTQPMVIVSIIIAMVWQAIGYYMVMYMASMAAVPMDLYESAGLDGAGRLTQFFQITLPLIWTNIRTTLTATLPHDFEEAVYFLAFWNEYIISMTLMSSSTGRTSSTRSPSTPASPRPTNSPWSGCGNLLPTTPM